MEAIFYITMLAATVSILFANDSAVLILTPHRSGNCHLLDVCNKKGKLAVLFTAGLIAVALAKNYHGQETSPFQMLQEAQVP